MNIDSYVFTSPGGRSYNEDSVGEKRLDDGALFVVADGLGGHLHGEVASACVVQTVLKDFDPQEAPHPALQKVLAKANEEILALQKDQRGKMKSTAVCLCLGQEQASWAHVGDSRLYHIHNSALAAVTADHSVAYKKYLAGEISRSQIASDEDQSSLLRSLGGTSRNQPDLGSAPGGIAPGDGFLLCSDGLWEYLHDQEILVDMLKTQTARQWAEQLLLRVMERIQEGNDNLSLITVRIPRDNT